MSDELHKARIQVYREGFAAAAGFGIDAFLRHNLKLNEPRYLIADGKVRIEALLDYDGLALLEEHLTALLPLLKAKVAPSPAQEKKHD